MLPFDTLFQFLIVAMVLTVVPGQDNLMLVGYGLTRGRTAACVFGLGCALGCLTHTLWVVLGLAALLETFPAVLWGLKMAGAVYLLYLASNVLRDKKDVSAAEIDIRTEPLINYLQRGFIANALNPKVTLFFLALLPQFADAELGSVELQIVQLGLLFSLQTVLVFSLIAVFSEAVFSRLKSQPAIFGHLDTLAALVFVLLAAALVFG